MRKALWSTAALVALLSGALVTWGPSAQAAPPDVTMGSDAEPNAFKFFPKEITVAVNSTVVWQNLSALPHDVKADNGSFKSDSTLNKGETYQFKFTTPGDRIRYICTVSGHEDAGMEGFVTVTGGTAPPVPPTTPTTAAAGGSTVTTAAPAGQSTTTTSAKAAAGDSTTTTTAAAGVTSTTQASSVTPSSAPETGGVTTTTAASTAHGEEAAAGHGSEESGAKPADDGKSSPIGIAFVAISTLLLAAISGKLLASKS